MILSSFLICRDPVKEEEHTPIVVRRHDTEEAESEASSEESESDSEGQSIVMLRPQLHFEVGTPSFSSYVSNSYVNKDSHFPQNSMPRTNMLYPAYNRKRTRTASSRLRYGSIGLGAQQSNLRIRTESMHV